MKTIAVLNHKGGVGKTSTCVNLAGCLVELGRKVLLLDFDPQASATVWLLGPNAADDFTTEPEATAGKRLFRTISDGLPLEELIVTAPTAIEEGSFDFIPTSQFFQDYLAEGSNNQAAIVKLKNSIAALPNKWDYLLIDCPGALNFMTGSALVAADGYLLPVQTEMLSLNPIHTLTNYIELTTSLNPKLECYGAFGCMVDTRTNLTKTVIEAMKGRWGEVYFKSHIRRNVKIAEAPAYNLPINLYASGSSGCSDFRALTKELDGRVMGAEKKRVGNG